MKSEWMKAKIRRRRPGVRFDAWMNRLRREAAMAVYGYEELALNRMAAETLLLAARPHDTLYAGVNDLATPLAPNSKEIPF